MAAQLACSTSILFRNSAPDPDRFSLATGLTIHKPAEMCIWYRIPTAGDEQLKPPEPLSQRS